MKSKRTIALIALVLLLAVAVIMDYQYGKNNLPINATETDKNVAQMLNTSKKTSTNVSKDKAVTANSDVFADYRQDRERTRSESIANLKEIVDNEKTSKENRDKAQAEIIKLTEQTNKEMTIENLIKAKGFKDVLVFIDDKSANVLIDTNQQLTAARIAQIQDIVTRETGLSVDQIHIIKRKS
ncbi:stage III sporulation protein AH [Caldanaerobius fijiensis DSM 17918]|uniref:Stage III sporulation protein AH n=1 Tax=Caldanaerobius fijiensis DSM 17918 TaxID=1121256 RepID=A0A1M4U7B9_9THEO|nr:SpoIIIAH-like family protein [Caldanaerobius fijiensis]SHE52506.1 stage III sporulation protein AH [Caldanaerobius fijiensis DSM 17918]